MLNCLVDKNVDKAHITVVLQPLRWCCVDCVIHKKRDVREE